MTKFEDNLWREVEGMYGPELSGADGPLHQRSSLRRPVIAGTSLGIVGASVGAAVILTAASSPPAFAVTPNRDGTVSVMIRRIDGIPGANRRLAQLGIHARAVQVADGCQVSAAPSLARVAVMTLAGDAHKHWVRAAPGTIRTVIRPTQIPSGRTLVLPAVRAGRIVRFVRGRAVRGLVPPCLAPAVQVRMSSTGGGVRIVACRGAATLRPRPVAPAQETNTTAAQSTTTNSGTNTDATTTTNSGTATNPGSTTTAGPSPSWTAAAPPNITLPPPLLRACRLAAQAATP